MKKLLLAVGGFYLLSFSSFAQQKEGKVIYERTTQMQMRFSTMNDDMAGVIPKSRKDKFELSFANNQSLWRQAEQENNDDNEINGDGVQIRMVVAGSDDEMYCNFNDAKKVELRRLFDKKFIVDDSIRPLKWKLSDETKTILNHLCRKAISVQYSKRMTMNMDNGKMESKEVGDTSNIVAWFTTDIPVSAGPAEFQGQLPGLILEMDIHDGRQVYKVLSISEKTDVASIKAPTGKKHYTSDEFNKEREKKMNEMQKNNEIKMGKPLN